MTIDLQNQLAAALNELNSLIGRPSYKIVISANEINHNHGVGIFLHRLFPDTSDIYSIRSYDLYGGDHYFGDQSFCLQKRNALFHEVLGELQAKLGHINAESILIIPYYPSDFILGLALKRLFNCPLCVFVMDDQNIYVDAVDDALVQQLLDEADLCFGISRPLCEAYQDKFKQPFWFFPPVIETALIQQEYPQVSSDQPVREPRGVLIGNIWSQRWLDQLRPLCRDSGVQVDWYGNPNRNWINFTEAELEEDNIFFRGFLDEADLIQVLKDASFAVILTGSSEHSEDRPELMRLSLPSRSCFMTATANIPLLVLGDPNSAIALFVKSAGLGVVCPYIQADFGQAVRAICSPESQRRIRANAFAVGQQLAGDGLGQWLWDSLTNKRPLDNRFEKLWPAETYHYQSVLVTACEINLRHGTGVLLKRVFPAETDIVSVRSIDHYGGDQQWAGQNISFGELDSDRRSISKHVASVFRNHFSLTRLFCVPYDTESLLIAISIKELLGIPMGIWIMDDQNIVAHKIPDSIMNEFLAKADVRFATHPEMREAYEAKFGLKFWLLPAVVPNRLIRQSPGEYLPQKPGQTRGALVGSIWSLQWFNNICNVLESSDIELDWFGNSKYNWLTLSEAEIQLKGLYPQGICPEDQLAKKLKAYPYVIVPTGTLDERDDQPQLSKLSLPGRILFVLATANTPIVLLGDPGTSAAKFVQQFHIGVVCDYSPNSLKQAVNFVLEPANQRMFRENAARIGHRFSDQDIDDWIWKSLELGHAADDRFESLFQRTSAYVVPLFDQPVPETVPTDYVSLYQVLRRLKMNGYRPDFVVDVGASHGVWSFTVSSLFSEAGFILIDPISSRYDKGFRDCYLNRVPNSKLLEIAISSQPGRPPFQISNDLYGSSLLCSAVCGEYYAEPVVAKTLDQVAFEEQITGRGILKIDASSAEHLVLEGASHFLGQVDLIFVSLFFVRYDEQSLLFLQMCNQFERLGYRYYDDFGESRSPVDGTLLKKSAVFMRMGLALSSASPPSL